MDQKVLPGISGIPMVGASEGPAVTAHAIHDQGDCKNASPTWNEYAVTFLESLQGIGNMFERIRMDDQIKSGVRKGETLEIDLRVLSELVTRPLPKIGRQDPRFVDLQHPPVQSERRIRERLKCAAKANE
jgi:hypothetical protein